MACSRDSFRYEHVWMWGQHTEGAFLGVHAHAECGRGVHRQHTNRLQGPAGPKVAPGQPTWRRAGAAAGRSRSAGAAGGWVSLRAGEPLAPRLPLPCFAARAPTNALVGGGAGGQGAGQGARRLQHEDRIRSGMSGTVLVGWWLVGSWLVRSAARCTRSTFAGRVLRSCTPQTCYLYH